MSCAACGGSGEVKRAAEEILQIMETLPVLEWPNIIIAWPCGQCSDSGMAFYPAEGEMEVSRGAWEAAE